MSRIIIIDDDSMTVRMISFILKKKSHESIGANNAEEGLSLIRSGKPDLVLLDLEMPDVSGLDVLRAIRGDEDIKDVRVCLMSGTYDEAKKAEGEALGAVGYISKPVDAAELFGVLDNTES